METIGTSPKASKDSSPQVYSGQHPDLPASHGTRGCGAPRSWQSDPAQQDLWMIPLKGTLF